MFTAQLHIHVHDIFLFLLRCISTWMIFPWSQPLVSLPRPSITWAPDTYGRFENHSHLWEQGKDGGVHDSWCFMVHFMREVHGSSKICPTESLNILKTCLLVSSSLHPRCFLDDCSSSILSRAMPFLLLCYYTDLRWKESQLGRKSGC